MDEAKAGRHRAVVAAELLDGTAGRFDGDPSMPGTDELDWPAYVAKVEAVARAISEES